MKQSKLEKLEGELRRMREMMNQIGLHLGIYQSIVGDLPGDVVQDVYKNMNPALVTRTFGEFVGHVRDTAAKMAQAARDKAEAAAAQQEGASHSPYSKPVDAVVTPQTVSRTLDTAQDALPPPSLLWVPLSRS